MATVILEATGTLPVRLARWNTRDTYAIARRQIRVLFALGYPVTKAISPNPKLEDALNALIGGFNGF